MPFIQMSGGDCLPLLGERVGHWFPLDPGDGFLDFADNFAAQRGQRRGIRPFLAEQIFLGDFQTIAPDRRRF